ncbi:MAG: YidC/Oxa1 family membrane protein insertase [Treponemataceae bacterium]
MLYNLIIMPIESIVDWTFLLISGRMASIGIIGAIVGVSLVINFLALPLYIIADRLQEKERQLSRKLDYRVKRIKKAFSGDEQFMILQTYYRQNNYHPLYVLRSSLSILIEIPFFIAAYHYLSNCPALHNVSWWIFSDLGKPDALFSISLCNKNVPINILPIIMTAINVMSGAIYTKGGTAREKIQLYCITALFLVLLYNSPSGLVIYWILNNIFSLVKNIVARLKHKKLIVYVALSALLLFVPVYLFRDGGVTKKKMMLFVACLFVIAIPPLVLLIKKRRNKNAKEMLVESARDATLSAEKKRASEKQNFAVFAVSCIALTLFTGLFMPASTIATSPVEFSFLGSTDSPLSYIWTTLSVFAGFFLLWPIVIYFLFDDNVKKALFLAMPTLLIMIILHVTVFTVDFGTVDVTFSVSQPTVLKLFSTFLVLLPCVVFVFVLGLLLAARHFNKLHVMTMFIFAVAVAELVLGSTKIAHSKKVYRKYAQSTQRKTSAPLEDNIEVKPVFHLSKSQKNVVVIFLDRAPGVFLPHIFDDAPQLAEQLSGCVFYPNTVSTSRHTTGGAPAMLGGYEYTFDNLNKRSDTPLRVKHNEASLIMPLIFSEAGFTATVADPPVPNYSWKGDLSIFDEYDIKALELFGTYRMKYIFTNKINGLNQNVDIITRKEIRNFIMLQALPHLFRATFYAYCSGTEINDGSNFIDPFSEMFFLRELTDFSNTKASYTFIGNDSVHNSTPLKSDLLTPADSDEDAGAISYKANDSERFNYQCFLATFIQLGKWFDYLRENDCFDNTRIVVVADHGIMLSLKDFENFSDPDIPSGFNTILLIKDFNCNAPFQTDTTFMTNADTLFLATKDLPVSKLNPFTKKELKSDKANGCNCFFMYNNEWNPETLENKTQFTVTPQGSWHVEENIFDEKNWTVLSEWKKGQTK